LQEREAKGDILNKGPGGPESDQRTYESFGGRDSSPEGDMQGNIWEEIGRYNMRSERANKELAGSGRCPEKGSME
jgi:hypothetical protein